MAEQESTNPEQEFMIQRLYVKDISYEAPNTPKMFRKEWQPKIDLDLQTGNEKIDDEVYEVVLQVTASVKVEEETAFVAEVKQAGIFTMKQFNEEQLAHLLNSYCPSLLYPYAREVVSDIVTRGSFPQLIISPVNFDMLYQEKLRQEQEGTGGGQVAAAGDA